MQEKNDEIKVKTTLSKKDYRAIAYLNVFMKAKIRAILFIIISLIVILELGLHFAGIRRVAGFPLYFDYFVVLIMIFLPIEIEYITKRMIQKDGATLDMEQEIVINDEGIICRDTNSYNKYEWPLMYRGYESNKYFLILVNIQEAVIIPKRDLDNNKVNELRIMIDKKILGKNKLKKIKKTDNV